MENSFLQKNVVSVNRQDTNKIKFVKCFQVQLKVINMLRISWIEIRHFPKYNLKIKNWQFFFVKERPSNLEHGDPFSTFTAG